MNERRMKILELVNTEQRLTVVQLAAAMNVSQVTIRKDLDYLESRGLLRREHGAAVLDNSDDIQGRMAINYAGKLEIARAAAALVTGGETVMIESGSCCALLAEELAAAQRGITVLTNSVFIAEHLRRFPETRVILLGGEYQNQSQVLVGPLVRQNAEAFFVDKLFLGTDGFAPATGFSGKDLLRTEAVQAMARRAEKTIILTESHKFKRQGVVAQFAVTDVHTVVTDSGIPPNTSAQLRQNGVNLHIVETAIEPHGAARKEEETP